MTALDLQAALAKQRNGPREYHPFGLPHDPLPEGLGRIVIADFDGLCRIMGPPSVSSFAKWTVAPVTFTPYSRTRSWTRSP